MMQDALKINSKALLTSLFWYFSFLIENVYLCWYYLMHQSVHSTRFHTIHRRPIPKLMNSSSGQYFNQRPFQIQEFQFGDEAFETCLLWDPCFGLTSMEWHYYWHFSGSDLMPGIIVDTRRLSLTSVCLLRSRTARHCCQHFADSEQHYQALL